MTKQVGAALFEDGTKLYLIYDGVSDLAMPHLFFTEHAAKSWVEDGMPEKDLMSDAGVQEIPVTIVPDASDASDDGIPAGSFASTASRKDMCLTGPRSFMEMVYANGATASRVF